MAAAYSTDLPPVSSPTHAAAAIAPMPAGARSLVPAGYSAEIVASGLANPRAIHVAPNGDLFVAESLSNAVRVYRASGGRLKSASFRHCLP